MKAKEITNKEFFLQEIEPYVKKKLKQQAEKLIDEIECLCNECYGESKSDYIESLKLQYGVKK